MHRIDRIETLRAQIRRFRRRGMLARAVSAADSARSYLNVVKRLMSPRRSFKRLNSDWTVVVAASVDSFFSSPPLASFFDFDDDDDPSHSNADDAFSFLSPAQVLLWSVVLVPGDANSVWNVSAQQYYQRETGNLKSFQRQPRFQFQVKVLDLYLESLAHKQEHLWRKEEFNLYDKNLQPSHPEPPDKRTGIGLSLSSLGRCLFEEVVSSKFSKSTAIGERINNYNLNVRV